MTESKNLAANYATLKAQLVAELFGSAPRREIYLAPHRAGDGLSADIANTIFTGDAALRQYCIDVLMSVPFADAWPPTRISDALAARRGGYALLPEIIQNLSQSDQR